MEPDPTFTIADLRRNESHHPNVDILRVQDVDLSGSDDPTVLEWAAQQGRVVLTNDPQTPACMLATGLKFNLTGS